MVSNKNIALAQEIFKLYQKETSQAYEGIMKNINSVILSRSAISQYQKNEGDYLPLSSSFTTSSSLTSCYGCNISFLKNLVGFFSREKNLHRNLDLFRNVERSELYVSKENSPLQLSISKKISQNVSLIKSLFNSGVKGGFNKNLEAKMRKAGVRMMVRACGLDENWRNIENLLELFMKQLETKLVELKTKLALNLDRKIKNLCLILIETVRIMKKTIFLSFVEGSGVGLEGKTLKFLIYLHKKIVLFLIRAFEEVLKMNFGGNRTFVEEMLVPLFEFVQKEIAHSDLKESMRKIIEGRDGKEKGKDKMDKNKVRNILLEFIY